MSVLRILRAAWPVMIRLSHRAVCPYGSHVPILMACCSIFKPERVLELGMGFYSTPLLLNPEICPSLKLLHSLDNDVGWFGQVVSANGPDKRWKPETREGPMAAQIESLDLAAYDMIFIDDSADPMSRAQTLQAVHTGCPRCPVIVHDAEVWQLRTRIWQSRSIVFDAFNPQTAVCLPQDSAQLPLLRHSKRSLQSLAHTGQIAGDLAEWESVGLRGGCQVV